MYIKIDIEPVACPRPKVTRYATYYPPKYTAFKQDITKKLSILPPLNHDILEIDLKFIMKRPKSRYRKKDADERYPHIKRPDIDNLIKSVLDGLQSSAIISDDSIVWRVSAEKWIASKSESPCIIIYIKKGGTKQIPPQSLNKTTKQSKQTTGKK